MRRQIIPSADGVASLVDEVPCLTLPKLDVSHLLVSGIVDERCLHALKIHEIES